MSTDPTDPRPIRKKTVTEYVREDGTVEPGNWDVTNLSPGETLDAIEAEIGWQPWMINFIPTEPLYEMSVYHELDTGEIRIRGIIDGSVSEIIGKMPTLKLNMEDFPGYGSEPVDPGPEPGPGPGPAPTEE